MSQRYFLTAESTYEDLRQYLNTALSYPNTLGKSVFQTALYAPRDNFRRVLLAVDTDLQGYATVNAAIAPLLASDAMEEIDEATYLSAVASATAGAATWDDITGIPSTFAPSAHASAHGPSGADALYNQSLNNTDIVSFNQVTAGSVVATSSVTTPGVTLQSGVGFTGTITFGDSTQQTTAYLGKASASQIGGVRIGSGVSIDGDGIISVSAAAPSHTHDASDIVSGTISIGRIPTGSTSTTVCAGNDSRLSDSRTPTGAAGGDLTGTYPNPTIAAGAVTLTKTTGIQKAITSGTAAPTGGSDGDIYLRYT